MPVKVSIGHHTHAISIRQGQAYLKDAQVAMISAYHSNCVFPFYFMTISMFLSNIRDNIA